MKHIHSFNSFLNESAKTACINCDEVNTEKAWQKNNGFCPSCKTSTQGVAESRLNEMSFSEIKDKYVDNPYGIGANSIEYIDGKYGNSSRLIFRSEDKISRDKIKSKLKSLGISSKKISKSTAEKSYAYRYELILFESDKFKESITERKGQTGLYVYPTTSADFKKLQKWLDDSDYYAEVDSARGYAFFPEEKDMYDSLEAELDDEFNKARISVRFEGE